MGIKIKMWKIGQKNSLTDIDLIRVGQAQDLITLTGTSVIIPERACTVSVDVRGGGPGTREINILDDSCLVDKVHAIALSGGSAFGLDAAQGTVEWLASQKIGFHIGNNIVPIVPSAILYDLGNNGDKTHQEFRYHKLAKEACANLSYHIDEGNYGAGAGALAGYIKAGIGTASLVHDSGLQIGALIAVNPLGSVLMPDNKTFWSWYLERDQELGGLKAPAYSSSDDVHTTDYYDHIHARLAANTVIGMVATNASLSKGEAKRVAIMAQDGLARSIYPSHTPFDGDTLFCMATDTYTECSKEDPARAFHISQIGTIAAECVSRAIMSGVYHATSICDHTAYKDLVK